jgi:glycosyltransferase involved in cell wall biosynthesis
MKIAIVRGNNINPFEMQSYAPLAVRHELTGYASFMNKFEADGIGFPVKRLHTTEEYYRPVPPPFKSLAYGLSLRLGGNQKMFGLEKELMDKDIIHTAETYTGYSYQAARLRKRKNKKLVVTVWENIPFLSTHQFMGFDGVPLVGEGLRRSLTANDRIVRYVKDQADILMAVTGRAKAALLAEGVPEEKIRVRPVGVDTERFKPAPLDTDIRKTLGLSDDDFVIMFMGRLEKEKGIYDLLNAMKLMAPDPDMAHVKVVIVGNGAERGHVLKQIELLGIEGRVMLAGSFPYETVPRLYNASNAFILPSIPVPFWQEQFGMVLVEAMASGLPVISTRSGSIPEVVGDAGILVEPNDPLSIAEGVRRLASDEKYCRALGSAARERTAEIFNIEIVSRSIESIYNEII